MTKIIDIVNWMNSKFPPESAFEWDNVGLLVGSDKGDTDSVVLTLDASTKAINMAKESGSKLIITHHPMIFGGIKTVTDTEPTGRMIIEMIKNDISCMAAHTNLDANSEVSNGYIANLLGVSTYETLPNVFCGVVFDVEPTTVGAFVSRLVETLKSSGAITINNPAAGVKKVFYQGGAFDEDDIPVLLEAGVDTVVSGEIKHHLTVLLEEYGINTIIAGHNATERLFMTKLADEMQESFPELQIFVDNGNEIRNI